MEWYNSLAKRDWTPEPSTVGLILQLFYTTTEGRERGISRFFSTGISNTG